MFISIDENKLTRVMSNQEQDKFLLFNENIWLMVLVVICACGVFLGYFVYDVVGGNKVLVVLVDLLCALIVFGGYYGWFLKGRGIAVAGVVGLIVIGCLSAGNMFSYYEQMKEMARTINEYRGRVKYMLESSVDSNGNAIRVESYDDGVVHKKGSAGELDRVMRSYLNGVASVRNDYLIQVDRIGWNSLLDAERLRNDKDLRESRSIIKKHRVIYEKYKGDFMGVIMGFKKEIEKSGLDDDFKRSMMISIDQKLRVDGAELNKMLETQDACVKEAEGVVDLLSVSQWSVDGGCIVFVNENDVRLFNDKIKRIREYVDKENAYRMRCVNELK